MHKSLTYILFIILLCASLLHCKQNESNDSDVNTDAQELETTVKIEENLNLDSINDDIIANPKSPNGYYKRAYYYKKIFDYENALADINRALKLAPEVAELNYAKGEILFNKAGAEQNPDLYLEAQISLDKALVTDSTHLESLMLLTRLNHALPNYEKAIKYINTALRNNENYGPAYFWKGMIFQSQGEESKAISSYQTAIEKDVNLVGAYNHLGIIYDENNDPLAIDYYKSALNVEPENQLVLRNLGLAYKNLGQYTNSIQTFKTLLEQDSTFAECYYNIGNVYIAAYSDDMTPYQKDTTTSHAIEYFQKAVSFYPEYLDAIYNLAILHQERGEKAKAKKYYLEILELDENNPSALEGINSL